MRQIRVEKVTLNIGAGKDTEVLEKAIKLIKSGKPKNLAKARENLERELQIAIKNEDFDYCNDLSEILNEPPEIIQAVIEPNPEEFEGLDENKKSIIKYAKEYIQKNTLTQENKILIVEKRYYVDLPISTEDIPKNKSGKH